MRKVVCAVLTVGDRYVMQLRDFIPGIAAPGTWGLFGGAMEAGESPQEAIQRELYEELGIRCSPKRLTEQRDHIVFHEDITAKWPRAKLREGAGIGVFTIEKLRTVREVPDLGMYFVLHHHLVVKKAPLL